MSYVCSSLLACPTCGPGCNYECSSNTPAPGVCESVPRSGLVSNSDFDDYISKTRGVPSKGSTDYGPRGQRMDQFTEFRNMSGCGLWMCGD